MVVVTLYLIEPRPCLGERLQKRFEPELGELLLEPMIFSNKEGGYGSVWTDEDHLLTIKLLFLAQLREYTPLSEEKTIEEVFGSSRLSAEVFDHWWTIRKIGFRRDAESVYPLLKRLLPAVERTGNRLVDEWLDWAPRHA